MLEVKKSILRLISVYLFYLLIDYFKFQMLAINIVQIAILILFIRMFKTIWNYMKGRFFETDNIGIYFSLMYFNEINNIDDIKTHPKEKQFIRYENINSIRRGKLFVTISVGDKKYKVIPKNQGSLQELQIKIKAE